MILISYIISAPSSLRSGQSRYVNRRWRNGTTLRHTMPVASSIHSEPTTHHSKASDLNENRMRAIWHEEYVRLANASLIPSPFAIPPPPPSLQSPPFYTQPSSFGSANGPQFGPPYPRSLITPYWPYMPQPLQQQQQHHQPTVIPTNNVNDRTVNTANESSRKKKKKKKPKQPQRRKQPIRTLSDPSLDESSFSSEVEKVEMKLLEPYQRNNEYRDRDNSINGHNDGDAASSSTHSGAAVAAARCTCQTVSGAAASHDANASNNNYADDDSESTVEDPDEHRHT